MSETDFEHVSESKPEDPALPGRGKPVTPPPGTVATPDSADGTQRPKKKLTKEEQMALYEEALKDEDWGHQPC